MTPMFKFVRLFSLMFLVSFVLGLVTSVYAQEVAQPAAQSWWKPLLDMALHSMLPALWAAIGPLGTAAITKAVNKVAITYVPRTLQVVLSGCITAVLAGLTGDAVGVATVAGMSGQVLAATKPEKLLTSEKPD